MNIGEILKKSGLSDVLVATGVETAKTLGLQVGRIASKPKTTETPEELKKIRSALINGLTDGYFKKEDGSINFSVLIMPMAIIIGLIILIRKI
jgi:hypothetical protein